MKLKTLLLLCICVFTFSSCSDDEEPQPWELISSELIKVKAENKIERVVCVMGDIDYSYRISSKAEIKIEGMFLSIGDEVYCLDKLISYSITRNPWSENDNVDLYLYFY